MLTEIANEFYGKSLDSEGRECFEKLIHSRDIPPFLYEISVWLGGALGLHRAVSKQYKLAFAHLTVVGVSCLGLAYGLLFNASGYFTVASIGFALCSLHWVVSILFIKRDISSFRRRMELDLVSQITNKVDEVERNNPK